MPSQLVKCAFGFRSFNAPKTKCVPLSVELGSEQEGHVPPVPPMSRALDYYSTDYAGRRITLSTIYKIPTYLPMSLMSL